MLAVVGPDSGGYEARMRALAAEHGVAHRVLFTGMLSGADRLPPLVDADLFGLPSDHENFGLAVIEALACGTPVLISDKVNIYREVSSAGVGLIVERDPAAIAAAIGRYLADPAARAMAASRARPFVVECYDLDAIAGRWIGHYRAIVNGAAGK